jgi:hypothetical protein
VARRYRGGQKAMRNGGPIRFDNRRKGTHAERRQARTGPRASRICKPRLAGLARAESAGRGRRPFEDARCGGDTRPTVVAVRCWRGGRFAGGREVKLNALAILHVSYNVCEQCIQGPCR